jgi:hypothetical protein
MGACPYRRNGLCVLEASLVGALADSQPGIFVGMMSLRMFLYIQFNQFLVCLYVRSGRDYY